MGSYDKGKDEAVKWICQNFSKGSVCLEVGACNGKWSQLLGNYLIMDAVEVWEPNIKKYHLRAQYAHVYNVNITDFQYKHYDLIIFGDVLEHLSVEDARRVVEYARMRCKNMLIAVPYLYEQGAKHGNPYEVHLQPDLTPEIFDERFPGFSPIYQTEDYAYYVLSKT